MSDGKNGEYADYVADMEEADDAWWASLRGVQDKKMADATKAEMWANEQ